MPKNHPGDENFSLILALPRGLLALVEAYRREAFEASRSGAIRSLIKRGLEASKTETSLEPSRKEPGR